MDVKIKKEEDLVLKILNKTRILQETPNSIKVVSVLALPKRFPGKVFVEAFCEGDVKNAVEGFVHVKIKRELKVL